MLWWFAWAFAWPEDVAWQDLATTAGPSLEASSDGGDGELLDGAQVYVSADSVHVRVPVPEGVSPVLTVAVDADGDQIIDVAFWGGPSTTMQQATPLSPGASPDGGTDWSDAITMEGGTGSYAVVDDGAQRWVQLSFASYLAGFSPTAEMHLVLASGTPGALVDRLGCDDAGPALCDDWSARTSPWVPDADEDDLWVSEEAWSGTSPTDADSDDDGALDGIDPFPIRCDGDGDRLPDGLEMGIDSFHPDTDLSEWCARADLDPTTQTDPTDPDSDGGSLLDGWEDRNRNGRVDIYEVDPSDPSDDFDSDGDHLADVIEGTGDFDGDGRPNFLDLDADGDGMWDRNDGVTDVDEDGAPAFLDTDADGDGLTDGIDGLSDFDDDGWSAFLDVDADGDGILDGVEGAGDLDGDDDPNHLDLNADGDRYLDEDEGLGDRDCDTIPNFLDRDDFDGFCDDDEPLGSEDDAPFDRPFEAAGPPAVELPEPPSEGCDSAGGARLGWAWLVLWMPWLRRRR